MLRYGHGHARVPKGRDPRVGSGLMASRVCSRPPSLSLPT
jgi:hypothetical protein